MSVLVRSIHARFIRACRRSVCQPARASAFSISVAPTSDAGSTCSCAPISRSSRAGDDVALVIKGFHYDHHRPWLDHTMQRLGVGRPGAAEVVYTHGTEVSVAGYFTAADVGVFPVRAECLGLPVLECLASGRPVIVTADTGLDEFCTPANARFIRATPHVRRGPAGVEPDVAHLRALLREAFVRGSAAPQDRERIRRSVAAFTWERSVARLASALVPPATEASARRTPPRRVADIPSRTTGAGLELTNRERTACGLEPITLRPIDRWQAAVAGAAARAAGVAAPHVQIRRAAYPCRPAAPRPARGPMRALFVAREPFEAGIRPLLEAWDRVRPRHAELVCAIDKAALRSPLLLRVLVRNPAITIRGTASPRTLGRLCAESDLVVQPSVAAATEVTLTALGRGRPVLIAAGAGGSELITHRRDGYVCAATSVASLRRGLVFCLADRRRLGSMARAAADTARRLHAHRTAK